MWKVRGQPALWPRRGAVECRSQCSQQVLVAMHEWIIKSVGHTANRHETEG
jgi:hypothetical protein